MADPTLRVIETLERMKVEAKVSMDTVATILRYDRKLQEELAFEKKSTPEEKARIEQGVAKLFGDNPELEASPRDIAAELGIAAKQGNLARISRRLKQLAITHRKAAE